MDTFKLTIDGKTVEAKAGMTVLDAAKNAGIFIPSLCAHDELSSTDHPRACGANIGVDVSDAFGCGSSPAHAGQTSVCAKW